MSDLRSKEIEVNDKKIVVKELSVITRLEIDDARSEDGKVSSMKLLRACVSDEDFSFLKTVPDSNGSVLSKVIGAVNEVNGWNRKEEEGVESPLGKENEN